MIVRKHHETRGPLDPHLDEIVGKILGDMGQVDGRKKEAARFRGMLYGFIVEMDPAEPLTATQKMMLRRLCTVCLEAEKDEAAFFAGEDINAMSYISLVREMTKLMRALGLAKAIGTPPPRRLGNAKSALSAYLAKTGKPSK